jgi:alkaline phosphatase D
MDGIHRPVTCSRRNLFRMQPVLILFLMVSMAGVAVPRAGDADDPLVHERDPESRAIGRIAFGSCCDQRKPQHVWDAIVESRPDLMVLLGDNVYADTEDVAKMRRTYAKLGSVEGFRRLRAACPLLATWDDHDFGRNDAGAEFPAKRESQRVFLEFFQEPPDSPRWKREGVYDAKVFGPTGRRVQLILLDTRYFRGPLIRRDPDARPVFGRPGFYQANTDRSTTILGEAQWAWLAEQLRVDAELRIIASSIQVIPEDHGFEKWMNFPHERERLFRLIHESGATGLLFVSGDKHWAEISRMDGGVGYPLFEITSSSLNSPRAYIFESNRHRIGWLSRFFAGAVYYEENFGMITADWERTDPLIGLEIRSDRGEVVIRHEINLSDLRPRGSNPGIPGSGAGK